MNITRETNPKWQPPCDGRGKDCVVTTNVQGSQYSRYKVHKCHTHGTCILEEPISVKIVTTFADGFVDTSELGVEDPRV